jgi:SOS-response transcriptional repressor LexA
MLKNKLSDNLSKILRYRQLRPSELARLTDLPPTTINKYLKSQSIPGLDKAYVIARALNVPLEALITGRFDESSVSFEAVPFLAEMPTSPEFGPGTGKRRSVPIPADQLPHNEGPYFAFRVRDESMVMAGLTPGAVAVVRYGGVLDDGDIAAVISEGEGRFRYFFSYAHTIVLQPANPVYAPTIIPRADAAALKVVGKVILAVTPY